MSARDAEAAAPRPTWLPGESDLAQSNLASFAEAVGRRHGLDVGTDYQALWEWSVEDVARFWGAVWDYFDLPTRPHDAPVLAQDAMPGAVWFPDSTVNFTAEVFRDRPGDQVAVIGLTEAGEEARVTWAALEAQVAGVAQALRQLGVRPGDRVVGYLGNRVEAVAAFLATASLGATWAVCGLDYSPSAAVARLGQLAPKVLFTSTSYTYAGRQIDASDAVAEVARALPEDAVVVQIGDGRRFPDSLTWADLAAKDAALSPEPVPFDHPLWVLFSSGTTGKPKGIVHGHGGVLLEHLKFGALHLDLRPGDRVLWYTTPSWMMWNALVCCMLAGASIVCLDGSPGHPSVDALWRHAAEHDVALLGTSPAYVAACIKSGVSLNEHELSHLRRLGITGSTFSPEAHGWLAEQIPSRVQIASTSGGTDVVTAFLGPTPWTPVWPGELSTRCLGVALESYDAQGGPVRGEVGELVLTQPMPSMPTSFWDDPDGTRYAESYFSTYPGVWRHGDWITITDRDSVVIHGRSDATLNRRGVRIGSSDIYAAVDSLPEVLESLIIGLEEPGDGYWMPLFVVTSDGVELDDGLRDRIRAAIAQRVSPRYLPDEIYAVPGIPHTRTGKKLEVPIKRILAGAAPELVLDPNSVDDPSLMEWYAEVARTRAAGRSRA